MQTYTNDDILKKFKELFDAENEYHFMLGWEGNGKLRILKNDQSEVRVEVQSYEERARLSYKIFKELVEYFGTENIRDDNSYTEPSSNHHQYDKQHYFEIVIKPTDRF